MPPEQPEATVDPRGWRNPAALGIGSSSFFADVGYEIPTSLLPSFLTATLGAPAAALGLIEGIADAVKGTAKLGGGALADHPRRRVRSAVGGYTLTAVLSAAIGAATSAVQVGVLRAGAWAASGLRGPARNALLADAVSPDQYGRAYGFERAMDNLGAIVGPLLALVLVATVGVRSAILLSIVPGVLAVVAILYAVRRLPRREVREHRPIRLRVRPVLATPLRRLAPGIALFEIGNVAATLLILRATELLGPALGDDRAVGTAIGLYVVYNATATAASMPAGRATDRWGGLAVLVVGVALFGGAYLGFALAGPSVTVLAVCFAAAGVAIGCVETAENSAVAAHVPEEIRGSAFGLLAATQSFGNLSASSVAGLLWTVVGPVAAFGYAAGLMVLATVALSTALLRRS
jgi:MFS family permease